MKKSYVKNECKVLTPVYVPGEKYTFYINFDNPITDPGFANFKLCVYDLFGNRILTDIGLLQKDIVTSILYNIFSIFEMPALANGEYCFAIWDEAEDIVKCTSNKILLLNEEYEQNTTLVNFRHDRNFYGYDYENLIGFYQTFRLPFIKIDYQYEVDRTQYRNVSDKSLRNLLAYMDKVVKIESYYFDEDAHDAAALLYQHKEVYFDGVQYVPKNGYQVVTDEINNRPKGTIECFVISNPVSFVFDPNIRDVVTNYNYLLAYYGDPRMSINSEGFLVFQDSRLIGKTNYGIYATQIPNFIDQSQIEYDSANGKFTILIEGFELIGISKLYIFYNIETPIPEISF